MHTDAAQSPMSGRGLSLPSSRLAPAPVARVHVIEQGFQPHRRPARCYQFGPVLQDPLLPDCYQSPPKTSRTGLGRGAGVAERKRLPAYENSAPVEICRDLAGMRNPRQVACSCGLRIHCYQDCYQFLRIADDQAGSRGRALFHAPHLVRPVRPRCCSQAEGGVSSVRTVAAARRPRRERPARRGRRSQPRRSGRASREWVGGLGPSSSGVRAGVRRATRRLRRRQR